MFDSEDIADLRAEAEGVMVPAQVYRLKPTGSGAGFRAKNSTRWPDDYAVAMTTLGTYESNPSRGREVQVGSQVRAEGDWKVKLKWDAGATEEDRTVMDGRVFNHITDKTGRYRITQDFDANEIR